jgi:hypothetical protein
MRGSFVILHLELDTIKGFLEHVDDEAGTEIRDVLARNESGEFEDEDDFDNALYSPLTRQEIAARAVYYEINALIERELQHSAHRSWVESAKHRGPKLLDFNALTLESVRSLKLISDLPFGDIVKLIEENHKIKIKDLDGGEEFLKMRDMVNAFKHRGGLIDFRKQNPKDINFVERYKADIEQAYGAIDRASEFIKALWAATDRTPS